MGSTKFVVIPVTSTDESIRKVASTACVSGLWCKLLIWDDKAKAGTSLPMTDAQVESMRASYVHNPFNGHERLIINDQDFPMGECSHLESNKP